VKLTPEEDELARRARSNWAFDSTKLRKGVAAAIRRGDEAMAAAEPKGIPAYRAVREWDNIPDDELIEVYHATSVETAEKMVREGIRVAEKPQGVFDPDKVDPGLFVGDSPERVRRYGRLAGGGGADSPPSILAVTVRKGDLEVPITETAGAVQPPTVPQVLTRPNVGATIKKDLPPSAFRILDEDAIARASEFDELVKQRGRIGMEKYDLERARDWGLEYDENRLRELTEQYDDLTRRMNEVTTTSRPPSAADDPDLVRAQVDEAVAAAEDEALTYEAIVAQINKLYDELSELEKVSFTTKELNAFMQRMWETFNREYIAKTGYYKVDPETGLVDWNDLRPGSAEGTFTYNQDGELIYIPPSRQMGDLAGVTLSTGLSPEAHAQSFFYTLNEPLRWNAPLSVLDMHA